MKISKEKKDKISEQILATLFLISPKPIFTSHIARELARDEEFIKKLLIDLNSKKLIKKINKNPKGKQYLRRARWALSEETYTAYKNRQ